jgi:sugar (glycoside-pentoside-hexuronide) transporter
MINSRGLQTYSPKERNFYLISMAGQNFIYNIIGGFLAYYLQFTILIPALAVSLIMSISRVWDALNDFMMGTIVDKTRSKWGKCRPYLIFAPVPIFFITVLCFTSFGTYSENASTAFKALMIGWAAFTYVLFGMAYTVGDIPLWSVNALMTEDEHDRNKMLSWARLAGGVGAGIVMFTMQSVAFAIGEKVGSERIGFLLAAIIFGLVGTILFQLGGPNIREKVQSSEKKYTLKENFKIILGNKPFRQLLLSGIIGSPKALISLAATPLVSYYYASKDPGLALVYIALLGGGIFLGQFLSMAATPFLIKRISKKNLYNYSNLFSSIPFAMIFITYLIADKGVGPGTMASPVFIGIGFVLFMLCGVAAGINTVLQSAMIADCIDYEEYKNGTRPDGVFFAGQTFLAKLTVGIATIFSGIAYTIVGFTTDNVDALNKYIERLATEDLPLPREVPAYDNYMMILFFLVSIPPAIGGILSIIPTWKYSLDDDIHNQIMAELNIRRHKDDGLYEKGTEILH